MILSRYYVYVMIIADDPPRKAFLEAADFVFGLFETDFEFPEPGTDDETIFNFAFGETFEATTHGNPVF